MMQVMCSLHNGQICDGTCGYQGCIVMHNRNVTITTCCGNCDLLRAENERLIAKFASQAAELRQLDEEIQRLKQTITWLTSRDEARCVWIHPEAMDDVRTFAFPAFKVKPGGGEPFICFVERPDPAATDSRDPAPPP